MVCKDDKKRADSELWSCCMCFGKLVVKVLSRIAHNRKKKKRKEKTNHKCNDTSKDLKHANRTTALQR